MEEATEEASTIGQFWLGGMPCSNRDDFLASRARERVRAGATATFRALSDGVAEKKLHWMGVNSMQSVINVRGKNISGRKGVRPNYMYVLELYFGSLDPGLCYR